MCLPATGGCLTPVSHLGLKDMHFLGKMSAKHFFAFPSREQVTGPNFALGFILFVETTEFFDMVAGIFDRFTLRPGASDNVSG